MDGDGEFGGQVSSDWLIVSLPMPGPSETAGLNDAAGRGSHEVVIAGSTTQSAVRGSLLLRLIPLGLGISVVPLDTAVNIAFPDITGSFHQPIAMIQWVVICYVLTHAGLMLAFGRVGDIWGHARVFRAGLLWGFVAFLLCAAAPSYGWLLFCRFLQGISAGLILSCAPALVTGLYPEARRSHALGIFTLMFALGSACGPLIGGALVARWGWPAVFWFRAPIALTSLLFLRGLPSRGDSTGGKRFDVVGAMLLAVGLATLLLAINATSSRASGEELPLLLIPAAAASLIAFVCWERRTPQPVIQVALFRRVDFALVNLASCLMYLVTFSVLLFAPYFLVRYTAFPLPLSGAVLATGFVAMAGSAPLAGRLIATIGAARIAPLGTFLTGTGLFLVGTWQPGTSPVLMVLTLALHGLGLGCFQVAYMDIVIAASPPEHRGVAGSLSMLTRTIGTVSGAASLTLGFQTIENLVGGGGADEAQAFLAAFHGMFRIAGLVALASGLLLACCVRRRAAGRIAPGL